MRALQRINLLRFSAALLLGMSCLCSSAQGQGKSGLERIKSEGRIVLAHRESSVPFSYVPQAGQPPVGYALDICVKLAKALQSQLKLKKLDIEYLQVTPANRLTVLENGTADMECGSTTNNAERRKKVAFTIPHFIAGARMLVLADSRIESLEDAAGKRVVSTTGTTPLTALRRLADERTMKMQILEAADHQQAFTMVEQGTADGFVMDDVLLYGLSISRNSGKAYKVVGKFITIEPLAIALPKNDPELKRMVDDEMRRLIISGEAGKLYDKWFMQPIPPHGRTLHLTPSYLLRDFWKYPTDMVPT
jgi:ABC-type amino acid transport substrate-binding protein